MRSVFATLTEKVFHFLLALYFFIDFCVVACCKEIRSIWIYISTDRFGVLKYYNIPETVLAGVIRCKR